MNLITLPPARREIRSAFAWHERQRPGAGHRFLAELSGKLLLIEGQPRLFSQVTLPGLPNEVRRAVLQKFPYSVVYEVKGGDVFVLAIAHAKRRPNYWLNRLTP